MDHGTLKTTFSQGLRMSFRDSKKNMRHGFATCFQWVLPLFPQDAQDLLQQTASLTTKNRDDLQT
jgi:hypothetical protein